eukprot:jgi/Tetstr1/434123/TSEL_023267.t1
MQFSRAKKHSNLVLSAYGSSVTLRAAAPLRFGKTALCAQGCRAEDGAATHSWSVRIDEDQGGLIAVGVALASTNLARSAGKSESAKSSPTSWAFFSKAPPGKGRGQAAKRSRSVWGRYGRPFAAGDIISCQLDCEAGTLRFFRNFEDLGIAFRGLQGKTLFPAVSLHRSGQRVTLLPPDELDGPGAKERLSAAVEAAESVARQVVEQADARCAEIRAGFDTLRAELAKREAAALKQVACVQEARLLQLWRQCELIRGHSQFNGAAAAGAPSPWPSDWASGRAASVEMDEAEDGAEGAGEEGDVEEVEEEVEGAEGEPLNAADPEGRAPLHLTPVVAAQAPLGAQEKTGGGLRLVGEAELAKLRDASRKADSAVRRAEKLRAALAKAKAVRKALELQIKRQNPLTPLDLLLTDETLVRNLCGKHAPGTAQAAQAAIAEDRLASTATGIDRLNIFGKLASAPRPPAPSVPLPSEPSEGVRRLLGNFFDYRLTLVESNLRSWVEQRSPACAAACVAGTFNAIKPADCPARLLQQEDVMEYYQAHWRKEVGAARRQLENFLGGGVDVGPLEEALVACGLASGNKASEQRVLEVLTGLSERAAEGAAAGAATAAGRKAGAARGGRPSEGDAEALSTGEDEDEDGAQEVDLDVEEEEEGEGGGAGDVIRVADLQPSPAHWPLWEVVAGRLEKAPKRFASLVHGWCGKAGALYKLTKEKPSTGPVGTDRLIAAIKATAEKENVDVQVWRLAGGAGKKRHQIQISENDQPEAVERQWRELLLTMTKERCCVVYHLENHYCLLYGAREWSVDVGYAGTRTVRQILVSKPGQRPCAWIDFEAARSTMLRWAGYCMVGVQALGWNPPPPASDATRDDGRTPSDVIAE